MASPLCVVPHLPGQLTGQEDNGILAPGDRPPPLAKSMDVVEYQEYFTTSHGDEEQPSSNSTDNNDDNIKSKSCLSPDLLAYQKVHRETFQDEFNDNSESKATPTGPFSRIARACGLSWNEGVALVVILAALVIAVALVLDGLRNYRESRSHDATEISDVP